MSDATLNPIQNVTRIGTEYYTYSDLRVTFHKAPSAYRTVNLRDLVLYACLCWHFGGFQRLRHLKLPDWHIFLSVVQAVTTPGRSTETIK